MSIGTEGCVLCWETDSVTAPVPDNVVKGKWEESALTPLEYQFSNNSLDNFPQLE